MATSPDSQESKNMYFIDQENAIEMARLLEQDALVTRSMGGLFSERADNLENVHTILDAACGPGGWVLSVAREYPHIQVTGVDISTRMVNYSRTHAKARGFANAHFEAMDVLQLLDFPEYTFDIVNARTLVGFMTPQSWPVLLKEMIRVCQSGGTVRLTEFEMPMTNSPAFEIISNLILQAMHKAGRSFSPDGRYFTLTPMLGSLLQDAGCQNIQKKPHLVDFAAGTEAHEGYAQDLMVGFRLVQPFLTQLKMITEKEFDQIHQEMVGEMFADSFCGLAYGLTVWGTRP
ncbi:MAG: methyltransferase domain-containing protein [Ktedonobacteraceae bacterium]